VLKTLLICAAIIISCCMWRYYSPYQTFMRDCQYNEFLEGPLSDKYCTWLYRELLKKDSWLREILD